MHSELIKKILNAKKIIREQRFNIELPADDFTKDPLLLEEMNGERLAVQGVIDLILIDENGNIELYDYKTDRLFGDALSSENIAARILSEKHGQQLYYYSKAIEFLMGKKCSKVAIYSTHSAKIYEIDLCEFESTSTELI